ncbi:MAG TPA: hypothetical protein VGM05_31605 [Planctomycetaceae bacterium]|jgi:hypothetical protein
MPSTGHKPELTRTEEQIVSHLINSLAFGEFDDLVDDLTEELDRTL